MAPSRPKSSPPPVVYIVSGGAGSSGQQLVHAVLAQFPDEEVEVVTVAHVRQLGQIHGVVAQAVVTGGTIVHTLVEPDLRNALVQHCADTNVTHIDLMSDLLDQLTLALGHGPVGRTGLLRQMHQAYFERIQAIEFTMRLDDGRHPERWAEADIVLTGVSRVGKTPLSMYLSVLGWRVANVPVVKSLPLPDALLELDRRRVFGLSMEPSLLLEHRRKRAAVRASGVGRYSDPSAVYEEVDWARSAFRRAGFTVIDVTSKPIETSADQVIEILTRRLGKLSRRR